MIKYVSVDIEDFRLLPLYVLGRYRIERISGRFKARRMCRVMNCNNYAKYKVIFEKNQALYITVLCPAHFKKIKVMKK